MSIALTPRDLGIITMVHDYQGCAIRHLRTRFFPGRSPATYYERLALLTRHRYVRTVRTVSPTGRGNGPFLFLPGTAARPVVASLLDIPLAQLPRLRPGPSSPIATTHHFALCDVRLALELAAEQTPGVSIEEVTPEHLLRRTPLRVRDGDQELRLVPDAAVTLRLGQRRQRLLLEVDLATEYARRLRAKLRGYLLRTAGDAALPVFLVTTTTRRQDELLRLAVEEGTALGANPTIFFVTTFDALCPETALTQPIWSQPGVSSPVSVLPPQATRSHDAS